MPFRPTEPRPGRRRAASALLLSCGLLLAACGSDGGSTTTSGTAPAGQAPQPQAGASTAPQSAGDTRGPAPDDAIHDKPGGAGQGGVRPSGGGRTGERPPSSADKGRIERTVKAYVAALDADDGAALCRLFAPGAMHAVKLPVHRGTCAATLTASVGHRGEPGAPRWLGTKLVDADTVVLVRGGDGRFTGTVVHTLAGREPSIEDDVVYLREVQGTWLIAKPSASFYRAIGARDVPVTALTPPR